MGPWRVLLLSLVACEPAASGPAARSQAQAQPVRAAAAIVAARAEAQAQPAEAIAAAPAIVATPVVVDAALVDRYPSLAYYPDFGASMAAALAAGRAREVLAALVEGMAGYRWPAILDWDRHGFIDVHGARAGFVTRVAGGLISQPVDRHDLGCAGGFLEGVRMTLAPDLAIAELDRCDGGDAVIGGPAGCDPQRDYGWLALRNIAARLRPTQLPAGARLFELGLERSQALDPLAVPGAMQLCTVSHESANRDGVRFYHHLMIVLATDEAGALEVFDTTGIRGVALTRMTRGRFMHYCANQLGASREYRYAGRSARLTCLPVAAG